MNLIVTIIGFGNVGKQVCSNLLDIKEHSLIINVLDVSDTVEGAVIDLQHACEFNTSHKVLLNNKELTAKSNFVFHCAGASIPIGASRLDVVKGSVSIAEEIFKTNTFKADCKIIVVSNPVEIIAFITQKLTNIPSYNVVGTGTYLDAARMNFYTKELFSQVTSADFILLGEHGASVYVSEQLSKINNSKVSSVLSRADVDKALLLTKGAAKKIKQTQGATIYGVSLCAVELFKAFLGEQPMLLPVSMETPKFICEKLDFQPIYLSLPAKVNKDGAFINEGFLLNDNEIEGLKNSYDSIVEHVPQEYLD